MSHGNYCIVKTCSNNKLRNGGVAFFSLPKDLEAAYKWIEFSGRNDLLDKNLHWKKNHRICSDHFSSDQFKTLNPRKLLWGNAFPSLKGFAVGNESSKLLENNLVVGNTVQLAGTNEDELLDGCRICLKPALKTAKLSEDHFSTTMIKFVFPELDLKIYPDPVICEHCETELKRSYDFKQLWKRSEHILQELVAIDSKDNIDENKPHADKPGEIFIYPTEEQELEVLETVDSGQPDSYTAYHILSDEHNYTKMIDKSPPDLQTSNLVQQKPKIPFPDIYNLLDKKYDEYFLYNLRCGRLRQKLKKLKRHDTGDPPYLCEMCGHMFEKYVRYSRHISKHNKQRQRVDSFFCDICGLSFENINVHDHYLTHRPRKYVCRVCACRFRWRSNLITHIKCKHEREKYTVCHQCGKKILRTGLKFHLLSHNSVQCHLCQKMLTGSTIRRHMRWHREGGYKCPQCSKFVISLRQHIQGVHEKDKRFMCKICGKGFCFGDRLRRHLTNVHLRSGKIVKVLVSSTFLPEKAGKTRQKVEKEK